MGERDAFGREKGEDDLEAMGWKVGTGSGASAAPNPIPAPAPAPTPVSMPGSTASMVSSPSSPQSPPSFTRPTLPSAPPTLPNIPRISSGGFNPFGAITRIVMLVVVVAIIGGIASAVISGVSTVNDVTHSITDSLNSPSVSIPGVSVSTPQSPASPSSPSTPAKAPAGLQRGSLLRPDAFAKALTKVRAQGGRVTNMRVDAERINAQVLNKANQMRIVSVTWDGTVQVVKTGAHLNGSTAVALAAVNSHAPERAVARSAAALHRGATKVNYLVLLNFAGQAKWYVYYKDGKYFSASLDGRSVQRIN
jgi:hypothetical protein